MVKEEIQNDDSKLVIVGAGEFAEIVYEYFTYDSKHEVVAFAVEEKYLNNKKRELFGLPIVAFESIEKSYDPSEYEIFVAITYVALNRARARMISLVKEKGYKVASYVSTHAFVWRNVEIGENTFVFEDNTVQYNASLGDGVILWSGNHIGHCSAIGDNCWITSHCVISGKCIVGKNVFMGVNATIGDQISIADDSVIGAGAVTVKSLTESGSVYIGSPAKKISRSAYEQFGVCEK